MKLTTYVKGELSDEELEKVTTKLVTAKVEADHRKRWVGILKNQHGLDREPPSGIKKTKRLRLRSLWKGVAAAVLVLALSVPAYQVWKGTLDKSVDQLIAADHFINREGDKKGGQSNFLILRQEAALAYNQQDYVEAKDLYQQLLDSDARERSDYFFSGLCQLKLEEPIGAAAQFYLARQQEANSDRFLPEIKWYLGLALVKAGDQAGAWKEWDTIEAGEWNYEEVQRMRQKYR